MKKTYNAPEMKVVKVQTAAGMLAQNSFSLNRSSERVSGDAALSRESGSSIWDDDEEDY